MSLNLQNPVSFQLRWGPLARYPVHVIFTDQTDGTEWLLTHLDAEPDRLCLTDTFTLHKHGGEYRPHPYAGIALGAVERRAVRLTMADGHLVQSEIDTLTGPRIITRRGANRSWKELYMPSTWINDGRLAWRDGI